MFYSVQSYVRHVILAISPATEPQRFQKLETVNLTNTSEISDILEAKAQTDGLYLGAKRNSDGFQGLRP